MLPVKNLAVKRSSKEHQTAWFPKSIDARTRTPPSQEARKEAPIEEIGLVNHDYTFPFYLLTSGFLLNAMMNTYYTSCYIFYNKEIYIQTSHTTLNKIQSKAASPLLTSCKP